MALTAAPLPSSRRPTRRGHRLTLTYSPDAIAAFLAISGMTFIPLLGSKAALIFLVAGMVLVAAKAGEALASLRREWVVALVTLWCVMSFAWSDYASLTMRYGIQLGLTVLICIAISYRLAPMAFVKIIFLTSTMAGLASVLIGRTRGDGMGYLGIYASKNALANASSVLVIVALAVLVDRRLSMRWRIPAFGAMLMGAVLLVMGQSSGALVSTIAVVIVFGGILLLHRMTPHMRLIVLSLAVVLFAAIVVLLASISDQLARMFLDLTGKDITLTGRTDLWAVGLGQIAERPILGVGFQAFWVHGQPLAEQLWADFGITTRQGFHFHNTIISNAVEIGIPATVVQTLIFFGASTTCLAWAIRSPSAASVFFALFMVRLCLLMWIEVVYFYQFSIITGTIIAAICYGHRYKVWSRVDATQRREARIR